MTYTVDDILDALNKHEIRATYGAVAGVLKIKPQDVGKALGNRRVRASWVVSKSTGLPTGYLKENLHKKLRSRAEIIETREELVSLLQKESRD